MKTPLKESPGAYTISLSRIKDLPGHRRPRELALDEGVGEPAVAPTWGAAL